MERHPLYEGERPERSNMQPMLMFNMHLGNKAGWERALYDRASHVMSGNLSWKKENQKLLYLPGCTVFIDDQRAIVYAPKTQNNEQHGFSLRSPLERFYGEDCELFYDNGLSSEGNVFYAGTYRCHLLNDTHPSRFMQAGAASRNRKVRSKFQHVSLC
ncbi:hypothetical protein L218DRAFT_667507 [Marasmius fiardii PR-910]|nr:hypothetical protein L218DRAFT_667507 [Marasmius fiardii PR-910]